MKPQIIFDAQTADLLVEQLASVMPILTQGRAFGIQVMVSEDALHSLQQSSHPQAATVLANLPCARR